MLLDILSFSIECFNKGRKVQKGRKWAVLTKQGAMEVCYIFECLKNGRAKGDGGSFKFCDCKARPKDPCCKAICGMTLKTF